MHVPTVSFISLGVQANTYVSTEENAKLFLWLNMESRSRGSTVFDTTRLRTQLEEQGATRELHKKSVLL